MRASLSELEELVDSSGAALILEMALPTGGRPRQLPARTLLLGMLLAASDDRPAHMTRVHDALVVLPEHDRRRLMVTASWRGGAHLVTYRQLEHMTRRLRAALRGENGEPSEELSLIVDDLLEASVPQIYKEISADLAVDWTDHETFARPRGPGDLVGKDPDASWGHRKGGGPGEADELFFGYYLQFATMVGEVGKEPVPELVRRMLLGSAKLDPPKAFVEVLRRLVHFGVRLGDILADCGYSYRSPENWAIRLRSLGASLVQDLHPADRGPKGTHGGAIIANGCLYCPATPMPLLGLGPLGRGASHEEVAAHDNMTAELSAYKLGPVSSPGLRRLPPRVLPGSLQQAEMPAPPGIDVARL